MLDSLFLDHLWFVLGIWVLLCISDYSLTLWCVRLYHVGAHKHIQLETLELTPLYQNDVAQQRRISPRHVLVVSVSSALIAFVWWCQRLPWPGDVPNPFSQCFRVYLGVFLGLQVAIHVRHLRNLFLFRFFLVQSRGIEGRICYSSWLSYRLSAVDLALFGVLYLLSFLLTASYYFVGGAAGCLIVAFKHWQLSTSRRLHTAPAEAKVVSDGEQVAQSQSS